MWEPRARHGCQPGACPHREQAEQVRVGLHWWLEAGHHGQLLQDAEQLLHLGPIKSGPGRVQPVRQCQLQGHQVLEVHAQDGEAEAHAGCQPPPVVAVVAGGRHQFRQTFPELGTKGKRSHTYTHHRFNITHPHTLSPRNVGEDEDLSQGWVKRQNPPSLSPSTGSLHP